MNSRARNVSIFHIKSHTVLIRPCAIILWSSSMFQIFKSIPGALSPNSTMAKLSCFVPLGSEEYFANALVKLTLICYLLLHTHLKNGTKPTLYSIMMLFSCALQNCRSVVISIDNGVSHYTLPLYNYILHFFPKRDSSFLTQTFFNYIFDLINK